MRVFVTGATGFIGSYLVPELVGEGHRVVGLSRSDSGADALARAGAEAVRGDLADHRVLRDAAGAADGVIHAGFDHDLGNLGPSSERDRVAIAALGAALSGSDRPLIVTSGTGLARRSASGAPAREADPALSAAEFPRGATEEAAEALAAAGQRVMVMRLPQVHDRRRQGRISWHIKLARERGRVAYLATGENRVAAVHVSDAVRLFRLVLEGGEAGRRYHAVAEEGVPMRDIAEAIGAGLGLPVGPIAAEEAPAYFGAMAPLAGLDLAASGAWTRRTLGWQPTGPGLLRDLRDMDYRDA